jgi:high-affinity nickel-transport protein
MADLFKGVFVDPRHPTRRTIAVIYAALILFNLAMWAWALIEFRRQPLMLGTALLAYGFGLRHAVDADHIAAIDNVTRKLMQDGKRPLTIGLFFALGHSAVVIIAAEVIAGATTMMAARFGAFRAVGSLVSTSVSAFFLLAIAVMNLIILRGVWRSFQKVRHGGTYAAEDFDLLLNGRGLLARIFRPLFRMITSSWQMLPLGFLFGLGFDTATEIALLGVSATQAADGMSFWTILIFPALFAAGMSLIDTTDGVLMVGAYDWAFVKPIRKLYYNITITLVSVVVAFLVGGIEALQLIGEHLGLDGSFWRVVAAIGGNFNSIGFIVVGIFVATWIASALIYRYQGLDRLEIAGASGGHDG